MRGMRKDPHLLHKCPSLSLYHSNSGGREGDSGANSSPGGGDMGQTDTDINCTPPGIFGIFDKTWMGTLAFYVCHAFCMLACLCLRTAAGWDMAWHLWWLEAACLPACASDHYAWASGRAGEETCLPGAGRAYLLCQQKIACLPLTTTTCLQLFYYSLYPTYLP